MTTRTVPLDWPQCAEFAGLMLAYRTATDDTWRIVWYQRLQQLVRNMAMDLLNAPAEPDPAADPVLVREFREADAQTPRTDAAIDASYRGFVGVNFARQLERDLATCHAGFEVVKQQLILALRHKIRERERAEKAEQERDALAKDAKDFARYIVQCGPDLPDHACAQCVPHGDILKAGFVCAYHKALISGRDAT